MEIWDCCCVNFMDLLGETTSIAIAKVKACCAKINGSKFQVDKHWIISISSLSNIEFRWSAHRATKKYEQESIYTHTLAMEGREILFHIWDFPCSQERVEESSSEDKRIQWADGFVLVYSICDRASFNSVQPKIQVIKAAKEGPSQEKVPIVIVGNKRDLHHRRAVSSEEGRLLALSMDCEFYEVSAAEAYHGAVMVFHGLAERICEAKLALKKGNGIRSIVKSVSAVFARKRTDSM